MEIKKCFAKYGVYILLAVSLVVIGMTTTRFLIFNYKKQVVLKTPEKMIQRLGRHFIVGYHNDDDIKILVEKGAICGIYITTRNISHKTFDDVRNEIETFQNITYSQGLPTLLIAADQEGGKVSRLSPLLPELPPLSSIVDQVSDQRQISKPVFDYAVTQARGLRALGVNVNLSPVVDLKTEKLCHKLNVRSRIDQRAISSDARVVSKVAGIYCKVLAENGIHPTLKHFPGLGNVTQDTHFQTGLLNKSKAYLDQNDWRPFQDIIGKTEVFIMLGHVVVPAIDPDLPASLSPALIDMIRKKWRFDGILITDDLNMGAIARRKEGIGRSAVRALNAGTDLILLSYDGNQYYNAMYEIIKAYQDHSLNRKKLEASDRRILASRSQ